MSANRDPFTLKPIVRQSSNVLAKELGKVVVLLGGRSAEREISLQSGQNILESLLRQGIDAHALDPDDMLIQKLIAGKYSRAFIALHGKEGEDGIIQGLLQMLKIPFTGSSVAPSALAMDKVRAKLVMNGLNIPTPIFGVAKTSLHAIEIAKKIGFPISIKPVAEGSSIGVTRVTNQREIANAFAKAAQYGEVMVEKWIDGTDFFVTILGKKILPSVLVRTPNGFYDYQAKYESETTQYLCPAPISLEKEKELGEIAHRAFCALGCSGWGRVDLMQDRQGKFWVLEVNTIPGMTSHSLVPLSAKAAGITFDELVIKILVSTLPKQSVQEFASEIA